MGGSLKTTNVVGNYVFPEIDVENINNRRFYVKSSWDAEKINELIHDVDADGGGIIVFPRTPIGSPLEYDSPIEYHHGIILEGAGRRATTLKLADGVDCNLIEPRDTSQDALEVQVRDMTLDGNNNTSGNCLSVDAYRGQFHRLSIVNAPVYGIEYLSTSGEDNQFYNMFIANSGNNNVLANTPTSMWHNVIMHSPGAVYNMNMRSSSHLIDHCYTYGKGGIKLDNAEYSRITNCRINVQNDNTGIYLQPTKISGKNDHPELYNVSNNVIYGYMCCGILLDGMDYWLEDIVVTGNQILYRNDSDASWPASMVFIRNDTGVRAIIKNNTLLNTGGGAIDPINELPAEGFIGHNSGVLNQNKGTESGAIAIDTAGRQVITVSHGLDFTPSPEDISLRISGETETDWQGYIMGVKNIGSTSFDVVVYVSSASATADATADISWYVDVQPTVPTPPI